MAKTFLQIQCFTHIPQWCKVFKLYSLCDELIIKYVVMIWSVCVCVCVWWWVLFIKLKKFNLLLLYLWICTCRLVQFLVWYSVLFVLGLTSEKVPWRHMQSYISHFIFLREYHNHSLVSWMNWHEINMEAFKLQSLWKAVDFKITLPVVNKSRALYKAHT